MDRKDVEQRGKGFCNVVTFSLSGKTGIVQEA